MGSTSVGMPSNESGTGTSTPKKSAKLCGNCDFLLAALDPTVEHSRMAVKGQISVSGPGRAIFESVLQNWAS